MRLPDFFIVGHQKCGTTALHFMLKSHPQIFMPEVKEPKYFASDLRSVLGAKQPEARRLHTLEGYLSLFSAAATGQVIGEASPQYLRSRAAAGAIAELRPDARIIAILREPASFLRSFHLQMVSSRVETQKDFEKALALEQTRREGKRIPRGCHHPESLHYSTHVRYVEQLRRFEDVFPRENMLVLIYDDFRADNEAALRRVLRFLQVDETAAIEHVEAKPVKAVRSLALHRLAASLRAARTAPRAASPLARAANALLPGALRGDAVRATWRRAIYAQRSEPDARFMRELRGRFQGEVLALSQYLGRDLASLWGYDELA